jgi:hypothetical protein
MIEIAIQNHSTLASDSEIKEVVAALQVQVSRDFLKCWGVGAELHFLASSAKVTPGFWQLGIFDDADAAGALGYHETTAKGLPLGKVFWGTTLKYSGLPSVTTSHELLEMLLDPYINLTAFDEDHGRVYAYEACDAVEADELGYQIGGVTVSDFVKPSYFEPSVASKGRSWCGHVTKAFELAPGGYMSFYNLVTSAWEQAQNFNKPSPHGGPAGRHALRQVAPAQRRRSTSE